VHAALHGGEFAASNAPAEPSSSSAAARDGASMSSRKERDTGNSPSIQPGVVGSNLATQCANPQCSNELLYLREGRLQLFELESPADDPLRPDDGAFAMNSLPSKFFWLCGECAKTHIAKRWMSSGLVLELRNQKTAGSHPINLILSKQSHPKTPAESGRENPELPWI
jgi:hypothetical protein